MANEISVRSSLQIKNGNLTYLGQPTAFTANMVGTKGPTPGYVSATAAGVSVSLAALSILGGMCRIMNDDIAGTILEYGIYDTVTHKFYPLGEALAGETYILRLSRYLGAEFGTSPGTHTTGTTSLYVKGIGQAVNCLVEAFDA